MRIVCALSAMIFSCFLLAPATTLAADEPPAWAYPRTNPDYKPPIDDGKPVRVPDSSASHTWSQLRDRFIAPLWHPDDHRAMPDIVAGGRKPSVFACGFCHRPTGPGGPENADLAGLPKSYILQQMTDYRSGARTTAAPERVPSKLMIQLSKSITDAEISAAADYFSALQPRKRIKVIETDTAPKTYVAGLFWTAVENGEHEPIGARIVEIPDDLIRFESRDHRATFTAYVPVGSLAKGEALVMNGGAGKTTPCSVCHGPDLKGLGPLPSIVGRSPSYVFRQLYDFQHGSRAGEWSPLMVQVLANLDQQDLLAIAAYLASRDP